MLDEIMTPRWFADWVQYYSQRPFGHWIQSEMLAKIVASNGGGKIADHLPRVEPVRDLSEDEIILTMPGGAGAAEFLENLNRGKINGDNQDA